MAQESSTIQHKINMMENGILEKNMEEVITNTAMGITMRGTGAMD